MTISSGALFFFSTTKLRLRSFHYRRTQVRRLRPMHLHQSLSSNFKLRFRSSSLPTRPGQASESHAFASMSRLPFTLGFLSIVWHYILLRLNQRSFSNSKLLLRSSSLPTRPFMGRVNLTCIFQREHIVDCPMSAFATPVLGRHAGGNQDSVTPRSVVDSTAQGADDFRPRKQYLYHRLRSRAGKVRNP